MRYHPGVAEISSWKDLLWKENHKRERNETKRNGTVESHEQRGKLRILLSHEIVGTERNFHAAWSLPSQEITVSFTVFAVT